MTLSILLTLENNIGIFASSFLAIMSNKMAIWLILICLMYNVDATPAQHIELQVFVRRSLWIQKFYCRMNYFWEVASFVIHF